MIETKISIYKGANLYYWHAYYEDKQVDVGEAWTKWGARRKASRALKHYKKEGVTVHE